MDHGRKSTEKYRVGGVGWDMSGGGVVLEVLSGGGCEVEYVE